MDNKTIVEITDNILSNEENRTKWETAYLRYANSILGNEKSNNDALERFILPKPFDKYSSISLASKTPKFDIRVLGQSVGIIQVKKGIPYLTVSEKKAKATVQYFQLPYLSFKEKEWSSSKEASDFRRMFKNRRFGKLKSEEHKIENILLAEFAKHRRADNKKLCNIQPVKLCNCFFQLTTPIKASTHAPSFSMNDNGKATGGGIDILARVKHSATKSRLAIIELKDENKKSEPQKDVMLQALTYATFIAHLLRSVSAEKWWKIFKMKEILSKQIELDVITLMPKGESEEGSLDPFYIDSLNTTLYPMTLYFDFDSNSEIEGFSGTLLNSIYQAGQ